MCRSIKPLQNLAPPATPTEVHEAALQYVRKLAGTTRPSQANAEVFARAVAEVEAATARDREAEAEKARARSAARFAS